VIVWSRGLGKQRLPLDLADATLGVEASELTLKGVIEPVCWNYAIRLSPADLVDFLKLMAKPVTARFLAEKGGLLGPFVLGLLAILPRVILTILTHRVLGALRRSKDDALLV
jgi:hypothetical protein